ncbi:hypothetical protein PAEPH01_2189, partial [Pancytospora epiphaga]
NTVIKPTTKKKEMLLFIGAVKCVYLLHRSTHKFLGGEVPDRPTPGPFSSAIDFTLTRGIDKIGELTVTDRRDQALDIRSGIDGRLLDYFPAHHKENQSFNIVLTEDGSFILLQADKCIDWEVRDNRFFKTKCSDVIHGSFDLYYEITDGTTSKDGEEHDDDAPPLGSHERKLYDLLKKERQMRPMDSKYPMKEIEDLNSSDLKDLDENGDSTIKDLTKFLLKNKPSKSKKKDTSSSSDSSSSSSSSCDEVLETFSRLLQNKANKNKEYTLGMPFKGDDSCPPTDKECIELNRDFTKYLRKYPGPKKKRRHKHDSTETSDCDIVSNLKKC